MIRILAAIAVATLGIAAIVGSASADSDAYNEGMTLSGPNTRIVQQLDTSDGDR